MPKLPPTTISPVCTHCRDLVAYRMRAQELRETVARAHEDPVALRYAELRDLLSEVHKKVNKYTTAVSLHLLCFCPFYSFFFSSPFRFSFCITLSLDLFLLFFFDIKKKSTSSGEDSKTAKAELENLMGQFHKQLAKFPHPSRIFFFLFSPLLPLLSPPLPSLPLPPFLSLLIFLRDVTNTKQSCGGNEDGNEEKVLGLHTFQSTTNNIDISILYPCKNKLQILELNI